MAGFGFWFLASGFWLLASSGSWLLASGFWLLQLLAWLQFRMNSLHCLHGFAVCVLKGVYSSMSFFLYACHGILSEHFLHSLPSCFPTWLCGFCGFCSFVFCGFTILDLSIHISVNLSSRSICPNLI